MVICFSMSRGVHFFGKITLKNFASSFPGARAALFSLIFLHLSSSFFDKETATKHASSSLQKTVMNRDEQLIVVTSVHSFSFLLTSISLQTIVYI